MFGNKKKIENDYTFILNLDDLCKKIPLLMAIPDAKKIVNYCKNNDVIVIIKNGNIYKREV